MSRSQSPTPSPQHQLLSDLLPPAQGDPKRGHVVSIKSRLAGLLEPEDGEEYWDALMGFMSGKLNRDELGAVIKRVLEPVEGAVRLHNALLLSLLYNTTRSTLPSSTIRHSGWHKRRRNLDGSKLEDASPRKRRLKQIVMALGKRERQDVKALALVAGRREIDRERDRQREKEQWELESLRASFDSRGDRIGVDGMPDKLGPVGASGAALEQEYMRCLQAPLSYESKLLPDHDTLQDRMSAIAYEAGLNKGADTSAAALGVQAIETHVKTMIASVIALIRANRASGIQTSTRAQLALLSASAADALPDLADQQPATAPLTSPMSTDRPALTGSPEPIDGPSRKRVKVEEDEGDAPLSAADMSALFDLSPGLLVQAHVAAVDKLYATAACSEEESSEDDEEEESEEEGGAEGMEVDGQAAGAGKHPKQGGKAPGARLAPAASKGPRALSRAGSRVGGKTRSRSGTNSGGREQFVIDPTAIGLPRGHPDVVIGAFTGGVGAAAGAGGEGEGNALGLASGSGTDSLAPPGAAPGKAGRKPSLTLSLAGAKPGADAAADLRNQLFPEDAATPASVGPGGAAEGAVGAVGGEEEHESSTDGESEAEEAGAEESKPKRQGKPGRRLYDVVDSVSLLSGVLE